MQQHEAATTAYWAAVRRHTGADVTARQPMTTAQHILHLLISVITCGLWLPVWFILAHRSTRTVTAGDPSVPMPVWLPPDPSAWGPAAQPQNPGSV